MVEDGAMVNAGDPLVVMIAMKMEYVIKVTFLDAGLTWYVVR